MIEESSALDREAIEVWTESGDVVERAQAILGERRCLVQVARRKQRSV